MLFRSWINIWYRYYLYQEQQELTIKLSRIWGARGMHPQSNVVFFIFMQFSALSNRWAPPGLAPLRNPGSATVKENYSMTYFHFYRPQTKFAKVMFLQVSVCPHGGVCVVLFWGACMVLFWGVCMVLFWGVCMVLFGGACMVLFGGVWFYLGGICGFIGGVHGFIWGCAWFYLGGVCGFIQGGMCGFIWGGHVWFYLEGVHGFIQGGMCGFIWGRAWFYLSSVHGFIWGVCMVLFGGGGMHGIIRGACVVLLGGCAWFYSGVGGMRGFFSFFGYNEIRSMSGWYASYWNAIL